MSFNSANPDVFVVDREKTADKKKTDEPQMWQVVLHNDDYTPMDFVVDMLIQHFRHDMDTAVAIMLDVHEKGKGIAGIYSHDIAETKSAIVNRLAQDSEFPFLTTIEKV